tara:strand:+ start:26454 stop:27182 length:729 start_codon:yes stop_codon:yes gene_type:complete
MRIYSLIIIAIIGCISCAKEDGVCFKSIGNDSNKTIQLQHFNRIEIYDKIDIDIFRSQENKAIVFSGENIIDGIELDISNKTLTVADNNTCHWLRSLKKKPRVELYLDSLESILFYGAGNLNAKDTIPSNVVYIEAWEGSGDINFLSNAQEIYLKSHTGVSHFEIKGTCNSLYLYNNTYAQFKAKDLISKQCHVASIGNGDISVFASDKLSIDQTGYSIIEYNASVNELNIIEHQNGELIPY